MSPDPLADLSFEQRAKLRQMLDETDRKTSTLREFDLAKPPVSISNPMVDPEKGYQYREFPFLMYDHEGRRTKAARNQEERSRMTVEGWSTEPFTSDGAEIQLTAAEHAEVEATDKLLTKKPRRL